MKAEPNIQIETHIDSPDLGQGHGLYNVLASALKKSSSLQIGGESSPRPFWPAEFFNLEKVSIFKASSEEEQQEILIGCSQSVLAESYYIEKCGMYFAPKMCLLAESTQEKMLYSLFAADEATHFNWISKYVSHKTIEVFSHNPFIRMLDELLQREDKTTLVYLVQVLLEGWGITHYTRLAKDCRDATLKQVFENILKDEARHHASGLILFNEKRLPADRVEKIVEMLMRFFRMAQVGPQMVVSQIERVKGHLSKAQRTEIFAGLSCQSETAKSIETLKHLIRAASHGDSILEQLELAGSFKAFTPHECAEVSFA